MSTVYELGPFRLDAEAGVLSQSEVPVPLGPRGVAVLRVLVERANQYVAKGSIIDAAWPGVVVEESNLAVQISAIRRVLTHVPRGRALDRDALATRLSFRRPGYGDSGG